MRVLVEPPLNQWTLRSTPPVTGVIATGHQPWLWHPGILAKDIAAAQFAKRHQRQATHLVVDTDTIPGLTLDLPVERGRELAVTRLRLASIRVDLPVGSQPPVEAQAVVAVLQGVHDRVEGRVAVDLSPLIAAWTDLPPAANLAAQISDVLDRLKYPYTGLLNRLYASELLRREDARAIVADMIRDAHACALTYNRAVAAHPEARIRPLHVGVDFVELPLWSITDTGRHPVFVDRIERSEAVLFDGIDSATLAPRALLLSAVMRACYCDLFIHGKGGGVYDRVTETWWQLWRNEPLAPKAVVSADVTLPFDVPVAEPADLHRAQWYAHHLPGNVDRVLHLNGPRVARKRELLAHMDDDRDKRRRAAAFAELHAINADLSREHADLLAASRAAVTHARQAVANRAIATRRDWSFALYPPQTLHALKAKLSGA